MPTISHLHAREILDSRGFPTVEVELTLDNQFTGRAAVPAGASTGRHEAVELRDSHASRQAGGERYLGKGVEQAVRNVNQEISAAILNHNFTQTDLDNKLIELDGTENKGRLGANAILGVSLAFAHAEARLNNLPLYRHIARLAGTEDRVKLPVPFINVLNGGRHADGSTDIQEFMLVPGGANTFPEALRAGAEVFHQLKKILKQKGLATTLGDEGGYAPALNGNAEALELLMEAIMAAGYTLGQDISLALDVAGSELYEDGQYHLAREGKTLSSEQLIELYQSWLNKYPIISIEDGLAEDDWDGWQALTARLGDKVQLVGDDLLVTNVKRLERGIAEQSANAILIKPNQIGTLSETIEAVKLAQSAGWRAVMSHRSGETEDTTIADLAVGLGTGQIKTGSLARSERVAKYNQLLRLAEDSALKYPGWSELKPSL